MKLGTVMIYVGEATLAECADWYRDLFDVSVDHQGESIWIRSEGAEFGLHSGHVRPQDHAVELYFTVDDIDAEAQRLRAKKIDFDGPEQMSWGATTIHLHDPAGTAVWLMQPAS